MPGTLFNTVCYLSPASSIFYLYNTRKQHESFYRALSGKDLAIIKHQSQSFPLSKFPVTVQRIKSDRPPAVNPLVLHMRHHMPSASKWCTVTVQQVLVVNTVRAPSSRKSGLMLEQLGSMCLKSRGGSFASTKTKCNLLTCVFQSTFPSHV